MSLGAGARASVDFLGLEFDRLVPDSALADVLDCAGADRFSYVVTPNVDHMVGLYRQPGSADNDVLWAAYRGADRRLCDSRILAVLARRDGIDLPVVAGSDLTRMLLEKPLPKGMKAALIGGDAAQLAWLCEQQPDAEWLHHKPPMGVRRNAAAQMAIAEFVEQSQARLLLFSIGAPQSELVCWQIAQRGKARGVALCIGASIEFLTGDKQRAPAWMQRLNLEWAFRLLSEPSRLWRRYLIEGPKIFKIWWGWRGKKG